MYVLIKISCYIASYIIICDFTVIVCIKIVDYR